MFNRWILTCEYKQTEIDFYVVFKGLEKFRNSEIFFLCKTFINNYLNRYWYDN